MLNSAVVDTGCLRKLRLDEVDVLFGRLVPGEHLDFSCPGFDAPQGYDRPKKWTLSQCSALLYLQHPFVFKAFLIGEVVRLGCRDRQGSLWSSILPNEGISSEFYVYIAATLVTNDLFGTRRAISRTITPQARVSFVYALVSSLVRGLSCFDVRPPASL